MRQLKWVTTETLRPIAQWLLYALVIILIWFSSSVVRAQAPVSVDEIERTVRQSLPQKPAPSGPFVVAPVPKLKEDFIGIQLSSLSFQPRRVSVIEVYEIRPGLYLMDGDRVVAETLNLGEDPHWLIAFGPDKSKYLLAGFEDPLVGFNKLIKDLDIGTVTKDSALNVFDLFLKTVHGYQFRASLIADEMHLQSLALQDFRLRYPTAKRKSEYNSWWARMPVSLKRALSAPKLSTDRNGFRISYFRYDTGRILQETVLVSPKGVVMLGTSVKRYPEPSTQSGSDY